MQYLYTALFPTLWETLEKWRQIRKERHKTQSISANIQRHVNRRKHNTQNKPAQELILHRRLGIKDRRTYKY